MTAPLQAGSPAPAAKAQLPANPALAPKRTSLDLAQLAAWRFSETNGFVVKDFTGLDTGQEPVIFVVKSSEIFEVMADAVEHQKQISVYAIGPCVLDLS
jgi:hypothetical protein